MEDRRISLSLIDGLNNDETFRCAQDMNQVSCYRFDAQKMVKLPNYNHSVDFTLSMNHRHS